MYLKCFSSHISVNLLITILKTKSKHLLQHLLAKLEMFTSPILTKTLTKRLTLLADNTVREGLEKLELLISFKEVKQVTDPTNSGASAFQITLSHSHDSTLYNHYAKSKLKLKIRVCMYMSEEAFESLSSAKKGK